MGVGWVDEEMEDRGGWWPGTSARDEQSHRPVGSGCTHGSEEPGLPIDVTAQVLSQFFTSPTQPEAPPLASTSDSSLPWGPAPELRPQSQTGLVQVPAQRAPLLCVCGRKAVAL